MTSTTTFIDKRETDPTDSDRLRRRRGIREAAARRDAELLPAILAERDIRTSEGRCDAAADEHATACAPWQQEIDELERSAIGRIADRQPADSKADTRRGELLSLINEANKQLEADVAKEREIQSVLRRKARLIRQGHPPADTILSALAQPPAASPRLLTEAFIAQRHTAHASARLAAAKAGLKIAESNLDAIRHRVVSGDLNIHSHKRACWEAELEVAESEVVAAMAASVAAHQVLINE